MRLRIEELKRHQLLKSILRLVHQESQVVHDFETSVNWVHNPVHDTTVHGFLAAVTDVLRQLKCFYLMIKILVVSYFVEL